MVRCGVPYSGVVRGGVPRGGLICVAAALVAGQSARAFADLPEPSMVVSFSNPI